MATSDSCEDVTPPTEDEIEPAKEKIAIPEDGIVSGEHPRPPNLEAFLLKDLDTGMKSYVTDQEWVEKSTAPKPGMPAVNKSPPLPLRGTKQKRTRSDELQTGHRTLRHTDHVRVMSHKKRERDFSNLYRWQRIRAHRGAIRVLEFNRSGRYLATAGQDGVIKIWEIDSHLEGSRSSVLRHFADDMQGRPSAAYMYIKKGAPVLVLKGHTSDITALSWSKNDFLLSASMDKTIRLWHPQAKGCMRRLLHRDIVTCVTFHPFDEQICISGTAEGMLHMWHLKEKKCLSSTDVDDLISACLITPDGAWVLVGTYRGRCMFYGLYDEIQGEWQFKHTTQMDVRSRRAKNSEGKKICGFRWYGTKTDQVMVSSNDSRLRLYRLDDKSVVSKMVGHQNHESQLNASFSPGWRYVLCASETRAVHIWEMDEAIYAARDTKKAVTGDAKAPTRKESGQGYESFVAQDGGGPLAGAVFAPKRVSTDALQLRGAFTNLRTSGLVIVTASSDGELRVFGCC